MGYVLSFLHDLAQALSKALIPAADPYEQGQARFDRERDETRARHGRVNDVEARRREWLHRNLRGAR